MVKNKLKRVPQIGVLLSFPEETHQKRGPSGLLADGCGEAGLELTQESHLGISEVMRDTHHGVRVLRVSSLARIGQKHSEILVYH